MFSEYTPTHSETLVFIGAGATATLGMPSSDNQTKIFRNLCDEEKSKEEILSPYFSEPDLSKVIHFLNFLDNDTFFEVRDSDLQSAEMVYGKQDQKILQNRILELRSEYDWNAAKKVLKICPHNEENDNLIRDAYSIIDKKLLAHQSLKVRGCLNKSGNDISCEEILSPSRLQGARNFLTLFINMLFAGAWYKISKGEKSDEFAKYKKFIKAFDRLMQKEGIHLSGQGKKFHDRDFYLFSTSFVSFNFEMVFPWIFMNSHYELNHQPPYIQDHPLKLWLDYGVEHRGRKLDDKGNIIPTLEFTESVASRENEDDHIGTPINRAGKFYFAHGSSAWRECPVCGRMTFFHGNNDWGDYKSKKIIPSFPIPLFESEKTDTKEFTEEEIKWRKELKYDSLQCMHCGSETKASDAPMIMQTMYKSTPTSFLEEIQRNVKISLEKAKHIVLLGYRLPPDDTIWQHAFAEGIRARTESEDAAFCTVVVGHKGEEKWINPDELDSYIKKYKDKGDGYGIDAIQNAIAIFGKNNVRAWTGGIPQVFGNCTEKNVKDLLYPDFVKWAGTRIEK
ncbi:MAG: hypothetical protein IJ530_00320 [Treponema sp.]|uniref:hypothetical protein n=1 Tax=Treponema sp. TaxID=166 RepID=UPI0025D0D598|nr:hypothetical protein [Treponema sp.]MBQ8678190.1 hypothetical protein [Treponema sp.]